MYQDSIYQDKMRQQIHMLVRHIPSRTLVVCILCLPVLRAGLPRVKASRHVRVPGLSQYAVHHRHVSTSRYIAVQKRSPLFDPHNCPPRRQYATLVRTTRYIQCPFYCVYRLIRILVLNMNTVGPLLQLTGLIEL